MSVLRCACALACALACACERLGGTRICGRTRGLGGLTAGRMVGGREYAFVSACVRARVGWWVGWLERGTEGRRKGVTEGGS